MAAHRAFYITQDSLTVWSQKDAVTGHLPTFADNDNGLEKFDDYLSGCADLPSLVLIDVIEEEFASDLIPKLGRRDRNSLLQRRLERKFPRTPFRLSVYGGKAAPDSDETVAIHSAISNDDLLAPWLRIILRRQTPLTGIYSVPMMAPSLLRKFYSTPKPVLLLTQHQHTRLRQVFIRDGRVESARLSQSPRISDADYPQFILTEIQRGRRYLDRARLLDSKEQLVACMVADGKVVDEVRQRLANYQNLEFKFIEPRRAARKVGLKPKLQADHQETLYLAAAVRNRPRHSYATSGESRYWYMHCAQKAIVANAVAAAAICSIMAGLYFSDAWSLRNRSAEIEAQVAQLSETFRRENDRMDPLRAGSHEMKLAVDTGEFILANRLPVPWVMQQVGYVLGDFPEIQVHELAWLAESAEVQNATNHARPGERLPVPIPAITSISVDILASISSFDGNMRNAFSRIDRLAAELSARTRFADVVVVEYPLDASPHSSISGEIAGGHQPDVASFRLRLRYSLQDFDARSAEVTHESV